MRVGDALLRPAQDGSRSYGGAVQFRQVSRWNEREYTETGAGTLHPPCGSEVLGVHTYNRSSSFEVIDRKRVKASC